MGIWFFSPVDQVFSERFCDTHLHRSNKQHHQIGIPGLPHQRLSHDFSQISKGGRYHNHILETSALETL
jgi:hypothetical protein